MTLPARLLAKLSARERFEIGHEKTATCWNWIGTPSAAYGQVMISGRRLLAHRLSFELHHGPVPAGLYVDHICRNKRCVNPNHLRAVTPRQNVFENSISPIIALSAQTHCKRGHPLSGINLVFAPERVCRLCRNAISSLYKHERRIGRKLNPEEREAFMASHKPRVRKK